MAFAHANKQQNANEDGFRLQLSVLLGDCLAQTRKCLLPGRSADCLERLVAKARSDEKKKSPGLVKGLCASAEAGLAA